MKILNRGQTTCPGWRNKWPVPGFLLLLASAGAFAQDKPCSPVEAAAAEKVVDRVVNFQSLYKAFQDYRHCDRGPVADLFTEAILRCIVEWKGVEGLAGPMEKDPAYRSFVYTHLKSPEAEGDLKSIYSRAKMSCPKGLEGWCDEMAGAAKPMFEPLPMAPIAPKPAAQGASPAPAKK